MAARLEEEHVAVVAAQAMQAMQATGAVKAVAGGEANGSAAGSGGARTRRGGKKKGKPSVDGAAEDEEGEVAAVLAPAGDQAAETDPFELLTTERFMYVAPEWR